MRDENDRFKRYVDSRVVYSRDKPGTKPVGMEQTSVRTSVDSDALWEVHDYHRLPVRLSTTGLIGTPLRSRHTTLDRDRRLIVGTLDDEPAREKILGGV